MSNSRFCKVFVFVGLMGLFLSGTGMAAEVTVHQHCAYEGYQAELSEGDFRLSDLQRLGVKNDDLSSIQVPTGYTVIIYEHDDFQGSAVTLRGDTTCLTAQEFNDKVSSIKVVKTRSDLNSRSPNSGTDDAWRDLTGRVIVRAGFKEGCHRNRGIYIGVPQNAYPEPLPYPLPKPDYLETKIYHYRVTFTLLGFPRGETNLFGAYGDRPQFIGCESTDKGYRRKVSVTRLSEEEAATLRSKHPYAVGNLSLLENLKIVRSSNSCSRYYPQEREYKLENTGKTKLSGVKLKISYTSERGKYKKKIDSSRFEIEPGLWSYPECLTPSTQLEIAMVGENKDGLTNYDYERLNDTVLEKEVFAPVLRGVNWVKSDDKRPEKAHMQCDTDLTILLQNRNEGYVAVYYQLGGNGSTLGTGQRDNSTKRLILEPNNGDGVRVGCSTSKENAIVIHAVTDWFFD